MITLVCAPDEADAPDDQRDLARQWLAALDTFIAKSQEHVTGEIRLVLHGGNVVVNGRRSQESLYDFNLATYDEGDTFDQSLAKGFVQLWGLPSKIDAKRAQEAIDLLLEVCRETGAALLLVSHDASVLSRFENVRDLGEVNRGASSAVRS